MAFIILSNFTNLQLLRRLLLGQSQKKQVINWHKISCKCIFQKNILLIITVFIGIIKAAPDIGIFVQDILNAEKNKKTKTKFQKKIFLKNNNGRIQNKSSCSTDDRSTIELIKVSKFSVPGCTAHFCVQDFDPTYIVWAYIVFIYLLFCWIYACINLNYAYTIHCTRNIIRL